MDYGTSIIWSMCLGCIIVLLFLILNELRKMNCNISKWVLLRDTSDPVAVKDLYTPPSVDKTLLEVHRPTTEAFPGSSGDSMG